ncbi:hypothetical protein AB0D08_29925 [Kitasatospora sp. NPDC048540]|uniref:hypothetical protein n=1 Tax=Kitasatospora sp. NPDC048540 TaxID=3155634 RepID=UPI0033C1A202
MAVVMSMHWPEITPELYDETLRRIRWEQEPPDGAQLHTAWFGADGFHVVDVWESQAKCEEFIGTRIGPVVKGELGVAGDPVVEFSPLHRRFVAPGVTGSGSG